MVKFDMDFITLANAEQFMFQVLAVACKTAVVSATRYLGDTHPLVCSASPYGKIRAAFDKDIHAIMEYNRSRVRSILQRIHFATTRKRKWCPTGLEQNLSQLPTDRDRPQNQNRATRSP